MLLLSVSQFLLSYLSVNLIKLCLLSQGQRKEEMELARIEKQGNEKGKKKKLGYFLNLLYTMTLNTMQKTLWKISEQIVKNKGKNSASDKIFFSALWPGCNSISRGRGWFLNYLLDSSLTSCITSFFYFEAFFFFALKSYRIRHQFFTLLYKPLCHEHWKEFFWIHFRHRHGNKIQKVGEFCLFVLIPWTRNHSLRGEVKLSFQTLHLLRVQHYWQLCSWLPCSGI